MANCNSIRVTKTLVRKRCPKINGHVVLGVGVLVDDW